MIEVLKLKVPKITNQNQSYNQKERMISKSYHNRSKTFLLLQHRGLKIFDIYLLGEYSRHEPMSSTDRVISVCDK